MLPWIASEWSAICFIFAEVVWRISDTRKGVTWELGGGLTYWGRWEMDEGGSVDEASLSEVSMKGTLREGSFTGELGRWGFWEICKVPSKRTSFFIGALLGNLEGVRLPRLWRKIKYIWVPFFEPEAIKILSLGAFCNFSKGTGFFWVDIRSWGTKGPSIKPRCIGTIRARTQC